MNQSVNALCGVLFSLSMAGVASHAVRCISASVWGWLQEGQPMDEAQFGGTAELLTYMNILLKA